MAGDLALQLLQIISVADAELMVDVIDISCCNSWLCLAEVKRTSSSVIDLTFELLEDIFDRTSSEATIFDCLMDEAPRFLNEPAGLARMGFREIKENNCKEYGRCEKGIAISGGAEDDEIFACDLSDIVLTEADSFGELQSFDRILSPHFHWKQKNPRKYSILPQNDVIETFAYQRKT
ncbi:hypothetical protein HK096_008121, partial [Nowakowskiella sp. JEL0078]